MNSPAWPTVWPTRGWPAVRNSPRRGESRALVILQKRPRTSPELQLSTNTIFPSLKPFHLTPWLFWNSSTHTPGDPAHSDAAADDKAWLRRPPGTYGRSPNGPITISNPNSYAKWWCGVTWLAGEDARPSTMTMPLFRCSGVARDLIG